MTLLAIAAIVLAVLLGGPGAVLGLFVGWLVF